MRRAGGRPGRAAGRDHAAATAPAARGAAAGPPPSVRYIRMFNGFFRDAAMTSTYKVALLRALADVGGYGAAALPGGQWLGMLRGGGSSGSRIVMNLNFAAARFAKFYWDMEVGFGLLHIAPGSGVRRRPRRLLMSRLVADAAARRVAAGDAGLPAAAVPRLDELASDGMSALRSKTVAVIQRDVLDAVSRDMPGLYEVLPGRVHIAFDADLVPFMREYGPTVKRALNHRLAVLLEGINPSAIHIATKTDEAPIAERVDAARMLAGAADTSVEPPADGAPGRGARA